MLALLLFPGDLCVSEPKLFLFTLHPACLRSSFLRISLQGFWIRTCNTLQLQRWDPSAQTWPSTENFGMHGFGHRKICPWRGQVEGRTQQFLVLPKPQLPIRNFLHILNPSSSQKNWRELLERKGLPDEETTARTKCRNSKVEDLKQSLCLREPPTFSCRGGTSEWEGPWCGVEEPRATCHDSAALPNLLISSSTALLGHRLRIALQNGCMNQQRGWKVQTVLSALACLYVS